MYRQVAQKSGGKDSKAVSRLCGAFCRPVALVPSRRLHGALDGIARHPAGQTPCHLLTVSLTLDGDTERIPVQLPFRDGELPTAGAERAGDVLILLLKP